MISLPRFNLQIVACTIQVSEKKQCFFSQNSFYCVYVICMRTVSLRLAGLK